MRRPLRPRSPLGEQPTGERSVTPVYERERSETESTLKMKGARSACDKVRDLLLDGLFHSAYELENIEGLKRGDWVVAVRELIDYGYSFDRRSHSLSMRQRLSSERKQDLVDLLALIDARQPETLTPLTVEPVSKVKVLVPASSKVSRTSEDDGAEEESPFAGEAALVDAGDRVQLSVDEDALVVSGKLLLTSTQAILAKKRSGKTYLAMVMAEQLLKLGLPFVAVDPTGVWVGLRSLADGTPSSYDVLTLGGPRGHWPIAADSGFKVADLVVLVWPRSVILDLSSMEPEDQHHFVYSFCSRMFSINTRPVHLFFDEADEFAPQTVDSNYKYQRRCLSAIDRLVRRGGVKGLGSTLITQRPAVINKNVLSQVGKIYVLSMVAPHDVEAVHEWMRLVVQNVSDRERCLAALPLLGSGEAFVIASGAGVVPLVKFMTRKKETYDSSRTPTMEEASLPLPEVSHPPAEVLERVRVVLAVVSPDESSDKE